MVADSVFREVFINELKKVKPDIIPQGNWVKDCAYVAKLADKHYQNYREGVENE